MFPNFLPFFFVLIPGIGDWRILESASTIDDYLVCCPILSQIHPFKTWPRFVIKQIGMTVYAVNSAEAPQARVSFRETVDVCEDKVGESFPSASTFTTVLTGSEASTRSSGSGSQQKYNQLRGNLTREQLNRDPFFFYETAKLLGEGSMGSVRLVRKRRNRIGGSARRDIQDAVKQQKRNQECLDIPLFGWIFRLCVDANLKDSDRDLSVRSVESAATLSSRAFSNIFPTKEDPFLPSNSSDISVENASVGSTSNGITYAMKSIILSHVSRQEFVEELRNEIAVMKSLDHPHIVRAIETFEHKKEIFIVMELCSGGDLYARDPYTEEEAARITSSILSAVSYMHSRKIVHRDLKYENILFVDDKPSSEIKLIDFGLSKKYGDGHLTEGVGTIYTMSPEVLKGKYNEKADMWSIGVIAYMLLSSQLPFYGKKKKQIVKQIMSGDYDFKGKKWKKMSQQAKDFIGDLLIFDPEERLDADTALRCSWLNRRHSATCRAPLEEEEELARASMLRYAGYSKLKKMALMVVAHKSSSEEIGILRKVFQRYDSRRDGSISLKEFSEAMQGFGHSAADLETMFNSVDMDGSGRIRYTEFIAATIEAHGAISEERLAEAFDRLDSDDSGYISADNLIEILGQSIPREEIDEIIAESDLTKDNQISYGNFLALWETKKETEKKENMKLLGLEVTQRPPMHQSRMSSMNVDPEAEKGHFEAHAGFLLEKHDPAKHHTLPLSSA